MNERNNRIAEFKLSTFGSLLAGTADWPAGIGELELIQHGAI